MDEKIRAFIAIELTDKETLDAIERYQTALQRSIGPLKLVKRDIMHVTLRFLSDITENDAKKICSFLQTEINSKYFHQGPIVARIEKVGDFNRRAFFVDIVGADKLLNEIYSKIENFLEKQLGFPSEQRGFTPHLTVARSKEDYHGKKNRENPGQISYSELKAQYKDYQFGPWNMHKVYLKKSVLTSQGPIYSNLEF